LPQKAIIGAEFKEFRSILSFHVKVLDRPENGAELIWKASWQEDA
jgi:hypothetical protein